MAKRLTNTQLADQISGSVKTSGADAKRAGRARSQEDKDAEKRGILSRLAGGGSPPPSECLVIIVKTMNAPLPRDCNLEIAASPYSWPADAPLPAVIIALDIYDAAAFMSAAMLPRENRALIDRIVTYEAMSHVPRLDLGGKAVYVRPTRVIDDKEALAFAARSIGGARLLPPSVLKAVQSRIVRADMRPGKQTHKDAVPMKSLMEYAMKASRAYGIDPLFLLAIAKVESGFVPTRVSPAGALGLMQGMPGTGSDMGYSVSDLLDPEKAMMFAGKYISKRLIPAVNKAGIDTSTGQIDWVLVGYNAGPGFIKKGTLSTTPKETQNYVPSVEAAYAAYDGNASFFMGLVGESPTVRDNLWPFRLIDRSMAVTTATERKKQ